MLKRGDLVMIFPEGSRAPSGRVETKDLSYGVGSIVNGVENCRVLCVYLRGDRQTERSILPARNQSFTIDMTLIKPQNDKTGLRAMRETALQIGRELTGLEQRYFACRQ